MIKFGVLTDEYQSKNNLPQDSFDNSFKISGICFAGREHIDDKSKEKACKAPGLSFDSLLNKSDAILFLGGTPLDQQKTTMALKRSRHIFLERTPELPGYEYNKLVKLADEAGVLVYIKNDLLNHPYIKIHSKNTDQTKHIEVERKFQEPNRYSSEILRMLFSDIQFISSVIRGNVVKSHVNGIRNSMNFLNFFHIHLEFDNGSTTVINYKWLQNSLCHYATLYHTDKQVILNFLTNQTRVFSSIQNFSEEIFNRETEFLSSKKPEQAVKNQNSADAIQNFLELLTWKSKKCISFEDSFRAYSLANSIYEKLEQNEKVPGI